MRNIRSSLLTYCTYIEYKYSSRKTKPIEIYSTYYCILHIIRLHEQASQVFTVFCMGIYFMSPWSGSGQKLEIMVWQAQHRITSTFSSSHIILSLHFSCLLYTWHDQLLYCYYVLSPMCMCVVQVSKSQKYLSNDIMNHFIQLVS